VKLVAIRERITRELAVQALAGDPALADQHALMLRVGRPLVLRHVRAKQRIQWRGAPYGDQSFLVEGVEPSLILFESPRLVVAMDAFLRAVFKGSAADP
jgi:hypothetical protein